MQIRSVGIRSGAICAAVFIGVVASLPSSATAATITDNLVPTNTFSSGCSVGSVGNAQPCQTDNAAVTYYLDLNGELTLEAEDQAVARAVLTEFGTLTDLSRSYDSSPSFSGSAETDIIYQEGSVPGSDTGYTWCNDQAGGYYQCDQQYIRIEGGGAYTHGLTCHETGHAVGLTHGSQASPVKSNSNSGLDCMQKPTASGVHLGDNSIGNINNVY